MHQALRIIVPIALVSLAVLVWSWMVGNPPAAERAPSGAPTTQVEVMELVPRDYRIWIPSQGVVGPRTRTVLLPQVAGQVVEIAPALRDGAYFVQDEVLLRIDARDYRSALTVAEALLVQRQAELQLEEAQHRQARRNWELLGEGGSPDPLLVREPQLKMAQANVESARARVGEARRQLERTEVRAPYAGRVLRKHVDVGQTVLLSTQLAEIFATDYVEIRLPVLNEHLEHLDLSESPSGGEQGPRAVVRAKHGSRTLRWEGRVVRTEGAFDAATRQLFLIAQVDDPYSLEDPGSPPLRINQYVEADIEGSLLEQVFVIPRSALREGREVLLVDEENRILRKEVRILWRDAGRIVVGQEDLQPGQRLSLTPLPIAVDGIPVRPVRASGGSQEAEASGRSS